MPLDAAHLYAAGGRSGSGYDLTIGAIRGCRGADACFVAEFTASHATSVFGRRVKVRGAARAGFVPLSCGASCSPPQIDFVTHGVRYTIQANLKPSRGDRAALVKRRRLPSPRDHARGQSAGARGHPMRTAQNRVEGSIAEFHEVNASLHFR
jgi:hypothetical protein